MSEPIKTIAAIVATVMVLEGARALLGFWPAFCIAVGAILWVAMIDEAADG